MATKKSTAPTAAQARSRALPDRATLGKRADHIAALVYRAKSIASAAEHALREIDGGEGSAVDGCLEALQAILDEAGRGLDCVVLFAAAEAQEVPHGQA